MRCQRPANFAIAMNASVATMEAANQPISSTFTYVLLVRQPPCIPHGLEKSEVPRMTHVVPS